MEVKYVIQWRKPSWREGYWEDVLDVSAYEPPRRLESLARERAATSHDIRLIERETSEKVIA